MIYSLVRSCLFRLDAEKAHDFTLKALNIARLSGLVGPKKIPSEPVHVMGLDFENPVGLAAGLDKNGAYIDALSSLGFGFIEIGTVTPRAQPGNPKPRLFRLEKHEAIINRMGFNNEGVDNLVENVKRCRYQGILGINIGKNFDTPIENAAQDYIHCLQQVYPYASYVTINISSPNTQNLRQLQQENELDNLLSSLKKEQDSLCRMHDKYVPLVLKIAPDLDMAQIDNIAALLIKYGIDGVIATNTTLSREGIDDPLASEKGGLSGKPLKDRSTIVIKALYHSLSGKIPIIGAGGIMSPEDAKEKLAAGATLIQVYSGLVFKGPKLVTDTIKALK